MKYEKTALRLREALSNKNMRPQDLANASGVNKASISQYLNGTHAPSNISSGRMAAVLGVSAPYLMGYDIDPTASLPKSFDDPEQLSKALALYEKYKNAKPEIQSAVETILKASQQDS